MNKRFFKIGVGVVVVVGLSAVAWLLLSLSRKNESVPFTEIRIDQKIQVGSFTFRMDSAKPSKSGFHYSIKRNGNKAATELHQIALKGVIRNAGNGNVRITQAAPIGISGKVISKELEVLSVPMVDLMRELDIGPGQEHQFDNEVSSLREDECLFYWQVKLSTGSIAIGPYRIAIPNEK